MAQLHPAKNGSLRGSPPYSAAAFTALAPPRCRALPVAGRPVCRVRPVRPVTGSLRWLCSDDSDYSDDSDDCVSIRLLGLSFFRGYSFAQPVWDGDVVRHITPLQSWNVLWRDGVWYWNPLCSTSADGLEPLGEDVLCVTSGRAIGYPVDGYDNLLSG